MKKAPSRPEELYRWTQTLGKRFPHLSRPFVAVLALYSFGMFLAKTCGLSKICLVLAKLLSRQDNTIRQRLREFYKDKAHKAGKRKDAEKQRDELDVAACFAPLLRWVVALWKAPRMALALDATTLGDRFVVLSLGVVYRGGAIAVAWTIVPAHVAGEWRPHWEALLARVRGAVPSHFTVICLTDRGLYAKWLYRAIEANGWHPLMRIQTKSKFRPFGWHKFVSVTRFAPRPGGRWQGVGEAFSKRSHRLVCTLLARWEAGHEEAWLCVTDLSPAAARGSWYGLRMWIEGGYRLLKRGLWQWNRSRMEECERAERLWLVLAVGTLRAAQEGGEEEWEAVFGELPRAGKPRRHSVYQAGVVGLLIALLVGGSTRRDALVPEVWPDDPLPWVSVSESDENTYP
jgi:hypothetical protein